MRKILSILLTACMLLSCIAASGVTVFAEENQPQVVYLAYPKENLNQSFPLVQKNKAGDYVLYAVCLPGYGATTAFKNNDSWQKPAFKCQYEGEQGDYLMFSADISKVGTIEKNADYALQFFTHAMTWTLTMTSDCLGDTVMMTGESVQNADEDTFYFVNWKNNPQCGMRAQLIANNTLWCGNKGCDKLPVYAPKATFIADALNKYLITSFKNKDNFTVNLNTYFADAEKNRANCEVFGVDPVDVYTQYAKDNAEALAKGENQQLTLKGQEVSAMLYQDRYYADLSYIAKVLGLTKADIEAYNANYAQLRGDVDGNGTVNGADAGLLSRYTSGWTDYSDKIKNMAAADINGDGSVNGADAGILSRYSSGWASVKNYFT